MDCFVSNSISEHLTEQEITDLATRRFKCQTCSFVNKLFPIGDTISTIMTVETEHDGVFLTASDDVDTYYNYYHPVVLRYNARTVVTHIE